MLAFVVQSFKLSALWLVNRVIQWEESEIVTPEGLVLESNSHLLTVILSVGPVAVSIHRTLSTLFNIIILIGAALLVDFVPAVLRGSAQLWVCVLLALGPEVVGLGTGDLSHWEDALDLIKDVLRK